MKNIVIILCGLLFILPLTSCKKEFLNKPPLGYLTESQLVTKEGVNGLLIGAYSLLDQGGSVGGGYMIRRYLYGETASDNAHIGTEAGAGSVMLESYTYEANSMSHVNARWRFIYSAVQRANEVIRILAKVPEGAMTDAEILQAKAEATFLRGYWHLEAALLWRKVPYIDETINYENGNYYVSNDVSIWPFIENDLKFASDNLTATKPNVGRINSWAAKAFLAKTYMFQHKFNEAKTLLEDIITKGVTASGQKYKLMDRYIDNFIPSKKNNSESVFAAQMSVNDGGLGNNGTLSNGFGYAGPYGGPYPTFGFHQPSFTLVNSYKTDPVTGLPLLTTFNDNDIANDQGIASSAPFTPHTGPLDSRLDWTISRRGIPLLDWGVNPGMAWVRQQSIQGPFLVLKGANPKSEPGAREQLSTAVNDVLIRFADVLLWAAEAEVEVGSLAKAEEYTNMVRARAANPDGWVYKYIDDSDPSKGYSATPAANYKVGLYTGQFEANGKDFARESVRFERKIELGMEGHRFFDLQRYDNGSGYMANTINAYILHETTIPNSTTFMNYLKGAKFTKGKNELFPIPQEQIDLSIVDGVPTLTQNPGY